MTKLVCRVDTPLQLQWVKVLFQEYAESRKVDMNAVGFQQELDSLPGQYGPPLGRLLLATDNEMAAGCVALRPLDTGICEMKRLYVRPQFRNSGLGEMLVDALVCEAVGLGYQAIRLDTFPATMGGAVVLYKRFGFAPIPAYWDNPFPGVEYMELKL